MSMSSHLPILFPTVMRVMCANASNRLAALDGDWHEFESKALRKENERKDKARRAAQKEKEAAKKRAPEGEAADSRDPKRLQMGPPSLPVPK